MEEMNNNITIQNGGGYANGAVSSSLCRKITDKTSRRITSLRFLLIVLVVFIHNNFNAEYMEERIAAGFEPMLFNQSVFGKWIQLFISDGLARAAVPLFFLFSSYLFFKKSDGYITILKKKFRSLFLPLVLWSAINLFLFVTVKLLLIKFMPSFVQNSDELICSGWNLRDWICAFIGYTKEKEILLLSNYSVYAGSLAGQFWFIRDLLIMMIVSPLILKTVRLYPKEFFMFSLFFYLCDVRPIIVMHQAWFFFVLGCYFAEYDFDFFAFADEIRWRWILPLFVFSFWYFTEHTNFPSQSRYFPILCACVNFLKLSKSLAADEKVFQVTKYLAGYSFFLFAAHNNFIVPTLQKLWISVLPMKNGLFCLAEYFGVAFIAISICTGSGILLKKVCSPVFKLLNGGRG